MIPISELDNVGALRQPTVGRIWHVSDIHFNPSAPPGRGDLTLTPEAAAPDAFDVDIFSGLFELAKDQPADVLVFSGDFVKAGAILEEAEDQKESRSAVGSQPIRARLRNAVRSLRGDPMHSASSRPASPPRVDKAKQRQALDLARGFITKLAAAHGISEAEYSERIILCPGNHDVDRFASAESPKENLAAFGNAFRDFRLPSSGPPFSMLDKDGLCMLTLDTAALGGTAFTDESGKTSYKDASAYSLKAIREALAFLPSGKVPPDMLGIVVAHHPPGSSPVTIAEIADAESLAAEQAKEMLYEAGFRLILHGHKHQAIASTEVVHRTTDRDSQRMLVIGATTLCDVGTHGLNIVSYALSRESGEARVRVAPFLLDGTQVKKVAQWPLTVGSRTRTAARVMRITERIGAHGDSRTDVGFHEVPVPSADVTSSGGWERKGLTWSRDFVRVVEVPGVQTSSPQVATGDRHSSARYKTQERDVKRGLFTGIIEVTAPQDCGKVTFVERTFTAGAYSISVPHQRRTAGSPQLFNGSLPGQEYLAFVVREPAARVEFLIRLPFKIDADIKVAVLPCVEEKDGTLTRITDLDAFTDHHIDRLLFAKRIRVSVNNPLVGVAYVVTWELPAEEPGIPREGRERVEYLRALHQAEEIRKVLEQIRRDPMSDLAQAFKQVFDDLMHEFVDRLRNADIITSTEELEYALFITDTPLTSVGNPIGTTPRPCLSPVAANFDRFPHSDAAWNEKWESGIGLAGRAYATDTVTFYYGAESALYTPPDPDPWLDPDIDFYAPRPNLNAHTALFSLPLRHPSYKGGGVVLGALCLGSYEQRTQLSLQKTVAETETERLTRLELAPPEREEDRAPKPREAQVVILEGILRLLQNLVSPRLDPEPPTIVNLPAPPRPAI